MTRAFNSRDMRPHSSITVMGGFAARNRGPLANLPWQADRERSHPAKTFTSPTERKEMRGLLPNAIALRARQEGKSDQRGSGAVCPGRVDKASSPSRHHNTR
jgi:hypothetical protein